VWHVQFSVHQVLNDISFYIRNNDMVTFIPTSTLTCCKMNAFYVAPYQKGKVHYLCWISPSNNRPPVQFFNTSSVKIQPTNQLPWWSCPSFPQSLPAIPGQSPKLSQITSFDFIPNLMFIKSSLQPVPSNLIPFLSQLKSKQFYILSD